MDFEKVMINLFIFMSQCFNASEGTCTTNPEILLQKFSQYHVVQKEVGKHF